MTPSPTPKPAPSRLILIKHAMPKIVPEVPPSYWQLSQEGLESCARLAERLTPYKLSCIISSEERKAIQTAEQTAKLLDIPFETHPNLHEHDRTGARFIRDTEAFHDTINMVLTLPDQLIYGKETANTAHTRFAKAIKRIEQENAAVVAHGTVIALYVARLTDTNPFTLWQKLGLPSYVVIEAGSVVEVVAAV